MEFRNGEIVIEKPLNDLDELILDIVDVLEDLGIRYAVVSGYVAVLFGRARATEDIDVVIEPFDDERADELGTGLRAAGYWGPAMPLDELHATLSDELPFRVAASDHRVPNVEMKFATDRFDWTSLDDTVTVCLPEGSLQIGSIELQIAYKLGMGAQKDYEDALYLHEVFGDRINRHELELYVEQLGVETEYGRLEST
jgi:hypothetical protein